MSTTEPLEPALLRRPKRADARRNYDKVLAAARNETVICEDMGTDPRWASIRDLVLGFGLRSCWSEPIRDSETGCVIGTFAMYRDIPAKPEPFHLRAVRAGAQLAGSALERLRTVQRLSDYTERFALAEGVLPERPVRAEGLEVHEVDDGLVVYQSQPECVHHLNNTAAIVFELCVAAFTTATVLSMNTASSSSMSTCS